MAKVEVDVKKLAVRSNNRPVVLTKTEFSVLMALLKAKGDVLSRAELLGEIWGMEDEVESRTLDQHISRLRKKLKVEVIRTHNGFGYSLLPVVRESSFAWR